jgi:hypothetical protein
MPKRNDPDARVRNILAEMRELLPQVKGRRWKTKGTVRDPANGITHLTFIADADDSWPEGGIGEISHVEREDTHTARFVAKSREAMTILCDWVQHELDAKQAP